MGSPLHNNGANSDVGIASIYRFNGTSWVYMQRITDVLGEAADRFGSSVAISNTHAFVGSPLDDQSAGVETERGCMNIFVFNGSTWVQSQRIIPTTAIGGDHYGSAISVSGNNLVVGAEWTDIDGNSNQGSLYFYRYNGTAWVELQRFEDSEGTATDLMGGELDISGNYAMAGVRAGDVNGEFNQGKVILFQKVGNYWRKLQQVTDPSGAAVDSFGSGVAIDAASKRFLIGAMNVSSAGGGFFGR